MNGSLQNRMLEMGVQGQPEPIVGMGVTELMWSDRHPYEIVRIDEKRVYIKPCKIIHSEKGDGYGTGGDVIATATEIELRQNKKGQWCRMIMKPRGENKPMTLGISTMVFRMETPPRRGQYYYDPGF